MNVQLLVVEHGSGTSYTCIHIEGKMKSLVTFSSLQWQTSAAVVGLVFF